MYGHFIICFAKIKTTTAVMAFCKKSSGMRFDGNPSRCESPAFSNEEHVFITDREW